jgi:hypothetical protein
LKKEEFAFWKVVTNTKENGKELKVTFRNKTNGRMEGRGIQIYQDGSRYEGWWQDNLPNGHGRMLYAS